MRSLQIATVLLLVIFSALHALPFFNSPTSQIRGEQWGQYLGANMVDEPENARYYASNRMRG